MKELKLQLDMARERETEMVWRQSGPSLPFFLFILLPLTFYESYIGMTSSYVVGLNLALHYRKLCCPLKKLHYPTSATPLHHHRKCGQEDVNRRVDGAAVPSPSDEEYPSSGKPGPRDEHTMEMTCSLVTKATSPFQTSPTWLSTFLSLEACWILSLADFPLLLELREIEI